MRTNAKPETLLAAMSDLQKDYPSLQFRRFTVRGSWITFTLKMQSGAAGSRTSVGGRKLPCAGWKVHGLLFDAVFSREPNCTITSLGQKVVPEHWRDWNVGGWHPRNMSELDIS